jgi:hypothetical protein
MLGPGAVRGAGLPRGVRRAAALARVRRGARGSARCVRGQRLPPGASGDGELSHRLLYSNVGQPRPRGSREASPRAHLRRSATHAELAASPSLRSCCAASWPSPSQTRYTLRAQNHGACPGTAAGLDSAASSPSSGEDAATPALSSRHQRRAPLQPSGDSTHPRVIVLGYDGRTPESALLSVTPQGLPLPPWRQEAALLSKWLPSPTRCVPNTHKRVHHVPGTCHAQHAAKMQRGHEATAA